MKTIYSYLIDVKSKLNIPSDNQLAKLLGFNRSAIAIIKAGGSVSDKTALKIAEALEIKDEEVLLAAMIQRTGNEKVKKALENISRRAGLAASFLVYVQGLNAVVAIKQELYYILCKIAGRKRLIFNSS
jgi:plasmid maintenance system antidote protein VapI